MPLRRRGGGEGLNVWPGYVDALSTLLMVIIFVLLVFVLAQAFLSVTLSGRDRTLNRLNEQITHLSDMLATERGHGVELGQTIDRLRIDVSTATDARILLAQQLQQANSAQQDLTQQTAETRQALAAAQKSLEEMRAEKVAADQTIAADRATVQAKLSDLARLTDQVQSLTLLRADLEKQVRDALAKAGTEQTAHEAAAVQLTEQQTSALAQQAKLTDLTTQIDAMRGQLATLHAALGASDVTLRDKDAKIADLGNQLNTALAHKVEELQGYRSEFYGKLREVMAARPGVTVVGDRFVFQSEVLFPPGGADLTAAGEDQIRQIAVTLKDIAKQIPADVNWVLRVDGHADKLPVGGGRYVSNWELSAARAINVVKLLIAEGVPANRLAATGFAENQPLDPADTTEAYAKNRRIEFRLTDR